MRKQKYYLYLTSDERCLIIKSLIKVRNELIKQGKFTDSIEEIIRKFLK